MVRYAEENKLFLKNDFIKKEKKPTTHTQKGMSSSYTRLKKKGS